MRPSPDIHSPSQQTRMEIDSDEDMHPRESSPDPLDFLSQAEVEQDVCVTEALLGLAEHEQYYNLEDALQYAFEANREKRLPSEPNQWKDIRGRPDASLWHDAALEEFNVLLENGTFMPVQLPAGRNAIGCR